MIALAILATALLAYSAGIAQAQTSEQIPRILRTQERIMRAAEALERNLNRPDAQNRIDQLVTEARDLITLLENSRWAILHSQSREARTVRELTKKAHFALVTGRDLETARAHMRTVCSLTTTMLNQTMHTGMR
ncbi:MAG: hypothetical protein OZSIB_3334 [Candidatus Ozemobacter sibiricus]|uniref:Uncharacterized protein n=1 Tax=Candidatus Ozemobacter sibiricus TaxID=2268124 RepID=A0A367ZDQ3_9BACT|nr:MAG: hypothetical protein OZSIB_3334 [Candidatus Ozemobacter sibiricus]